MGGDVTEQVERMGTLADAERILVRGPPNRRASSSRLSSGRGSSPAISSTQAHWPDYRIIASAQSKWLVRRVIALAPFKPETVAVAWHLALFVLLIAAFTLPYRFLPYARVAPGAALVGGMTAAALWNLAGLAFAALIASSTSYAAVYSSFAVLVLFLLWLQVAWLVVLVGGQVAYVHQHPTSYVAVRGRPTRACASVRVWRPSSRSRAAIWPENLRCASKTSPGYAPASPLGSVEVLDT
jgi:hypothetical protein